MFFLGLPFFYLFAYVVLASRYYQFLLVLEYIYIYIVSSADESLKDETRLLVFRVGSLVTLYTLAFTHITSVVKPVHIFITRSRVSKNRLKAELSFHCYVHFACVLICISITTKQSIKSIYRKSNYKMKRVINLLKRKMKKL